MREISIDLDAGISTGYGSRVYYSADAAPLEALLGDFPSVFVLYDENVEVFARRITGPLGGRLLSCLGLEISESVKTLTTVEYICKALMAASADRRTLLLAVGGGITTDMGGFAAAIYKRGIPFAFVPTTLLAQVDAATGGKTGVNFMGLKNMLGVIRQPEFTFITPVALEGLDGRAFLSGGAELLKTFIIDNASGGYQKAVSLLSARRNLPAGQSVDGALAEVIFDAVAVKVAIVSRDPCEKGERRKLNLGHSFAHAIEALAMERGADISHGEAVSMGIVLAARLASARFPGDEELRRLALRIEEDFANCGLKVGSPYTVRELEKAMTKDKKAEGTAVRFILPLAIGRVTESLMTPAEAVALLEQAGEVLKS